MVPARDVSYSKPANCLAPLLVSYPMRLVVDRNVLCTPELRNFLGRDARNQAVLTDYLAHDIFSAPDTRTVREAFGILTPYSRQVIVLKSTAVIGRLNWQKSGLVNRLIDVEQTRLFPGYCNAIHRRDGGMTKDLLAKSGRAYDHVSRLVTSAEVIRKRFVTEIEEYPKNEVDCIRREEPISETFRQRLIRDVISNTKSLYAELGFSPGQRPPLSLVKNSFQFRFTLCLAILQLLWTKRGNAPQKPEGVRNSITDLTYAAYASYFDGIMTNDRDLLLIFNASREVLGKLFGIPFKRSYQRL